MWDVIENHIVTNYEMFFCKHSFSSHVNDMWNFNQITLTLTLEKQKCVVSIGIQNSLILSLVVKT